MNKSAGTVETNGVEEDSQLCCVTVELCMQQTTHNNNVLKALLIRMTQARNGNTSSQLSLQEEKAGPVRTTKGPERFAMASAAAGYRLPVQSPCEVTALQKPPGVGCLVHVCRFGGGVVTSV